MKNERLHRLVALLALAIGGAFASGCEPGPDVEVLCQEAEQRASTCTPVRPVFREFCEAQAERQCSPVALEAWSVYSWCQGLSCDPDEFDLSASISITDAQNGVTSKACRDRLKSLPEGCLKAFGTVFGTKTSTTS